MKQMKRWIDRAWRSVVVKLWGTIILLVAVVLLIVGGFLLQYVDFLSLENERQIKLLFVIAGIVGFSLSTIFAFFLSKKIQQPLLQLKAAAYSISQGNYDTRVHIRSTDDIGELASSFNHMTDQLDKLIHDLQHEKNQLSSILRSMSDSVVTFDVAGNVIMTNPSGHLLMKQWSSLAMEWPEDDDVHVHAPQTEIPLPLREMLDSVMREGRDAADKVHVLGSVWSVVMAPLQSNSILRGAVAVIRNVTEEHKLEKLREDFTANISHEVRTPLSMIQGYSEALMDDIAGTDEERKELVQIIHDESIRMGRLMNDFLDIARLEAGHVDMTYHEINLNQLMKKVHRKFLGYAKEQEIKLRLELPERSLIMMEADDDRLEQVLTNLLDNAMRHTESGRSISLSGTHAFVNDVEYIQLTVSDEGQGIPSEDLPYIFERFYKADKARKRGAIGGTGLGLAIVKNMIDLHHGSIAVESKIGQGTTFTILLPVDSHQVVVTKRS